jgi:hypothetical protein
LACVAAYHAIDRASYPKKPGNLRKEWEKTLEFAIVDMVVHRFKHVISDPEKGPVKNGAIPLSSLIFGNQTLGNFTLDKNRLSRGGIDLHNLYFVILGCISFIRNQRKAH